MIDTPNRPDYAHSISKNEIINRYTSLSTLIDNFKSTLNDLQKKIQKYKNEDQAQLEKTKTQLEEVKNNFIKYLGDYRKAILDTMGNYNNSSSENKAQNFFHTKEMIENITARLWANALGDELSVLYDEEVTLYPYFKDSVYMRLDAGIGSEPTNYINDKLAILRMIHCLSGKSSLGYTLYKTTPRTNIDQIPFVNGNDYIQVRGNWTNSSFAQLVWKIVPGQDSVKCFDFHLVYETLDNPLSRYFCQSDGSLTLKEEYDGQDRLKIRRVFNGTLLINGCSIFDSMDKLEVSCVYYNGVNDIEDRDGDPNKGIEPSFEFKVARDHNTNEIYVYLERIVPHKLLWFDLSGKTYRKIGETEDSYLVTTVLRDIREVNSLLGEFDNQYKRFNVHLPSTKNFWGETDNIIFDRSTEAQELLKPIRITKENNDHWLASNFKVTMTLKDRSLGKTLDNLRLVNEGSIVGLENFHSVDWILEPKQMGAVTYDNLTHKTEYPIGSNAGFHIGLDTHIITNSVVDPASKRNVINKSLDDITNEVVEYLDKYDALSYRVKMTVYTSVGSDGFVDDLSKPDMQFYEIGFRNNEGYHLRNHRYNPRFSYKRGLLSVPNDEREMKSVLSNGFVEVIEIDGYDEDDNPIFNNDTSYTGPISWESSKQEKPLDMINNNKYNGHYMDPRRYERGLNKFPGYVRLEIDIMHSRYHLAGDVDGYTSIKDIGTRQHVLTTPEEINDKRDQTGFNEKTFFLVSEIGDEE